MSGVHNEHASAEAMTNLDRYKHKLKTQRVTDHQQSSQTPSMTYKASVRDTVSKLQEQSRFNGDAYGTNQFSSMDIRTNDNRNGSRDQENVKVTKNNRRDGSDTERLDDDTTSEDGRAGHGKTTGQRQARDRSATAADRAAGATEYA